MDQGVHAGHGTVAGGVHDRDVGAVHLVHPHDPVGVEAQPGGHGDAVLRHGERVVPHVAGEVQGGPRPAGHPAVPVGQGGADAPRAGRQVDAPRDHAVPAPDRGAGRARLT